MNATIRQYWQQWSAQFHVRSMRERVLMAAGSVVVIIVLFDSLALSPLAVRQKRLAQEVADARNTIKTNEALIAANQGQADPDEVRRRYRDELRKQVAEIDGRLQGLQKKLVPPDQVARLLEGVLARQRGPALVGLRKLPVQRYQTAGAAPMVEGKTVGGGTVGNKGGENQAADDNAGPGRNIYQHSFEITVEGSYADLHGYLAKLEKLPWQLFWGRLDLDAGAHPRVRLTLTVHTLSLNRIWLVV